MGIWSVSARPQAGQARAYHSAWGRADRSVTLSPGAPQAGQAAGFSGSARQAGHNLAGAVEYAGGGFALMTLAASHGQPFRAAGFIVLGAVIALSVLPSTTVRGAIQRVAETCLFAGLALAIWLTAGPG